jgi:hypothetical protein
LFVLGCAWGLGGVLALGFLLWVENGDKEGKEIPALSGE